jgi:hypothetical protein
MSAVHRFQMKYFLPALVISFVAEIAASYWTWGRAPTDGLRVVYEMNFTKYASERLLPWFVIFVVLWAVFLWIARTRSKRLQE